MSPVSPTNSFDNEPPAIATTPSRYGIKMFVGNRSPSIYDTIEIDNTPFDLTGCTATFKMRPANGSALKVDSAAVIVQSGAVDTGVVRYDWAGVDVDTEGEYRGWFRITLPTGFYQDAPEFVIRFEGHTPGFATNTGYIADDLRQLMPVTYDALAQDPRYGEGQLQRRIDYVKYKLFGTVVSPAAEATVYNPHLIDYVSKEAALQIVPAAIEYWMSQHSTVQTSGTHESVSYPDRVNALKSLQAWLVSEVAALRQDFEGQFTVRRSGHVPKVGNGGNLITPDPQTFGKQTADDRFFPRNLPWGPF